MLKDGYIIFQRQAQTINSQTTVPPVRGVMEVNIFLQIKEDQCVGVVLVAKRLPNGGVMQPGCLVKRHAIHSVLGEGELMLVKAFMGDKDHGFVSINPKDQAAIKKSVDSLYCLDEIKKIMPASLLKRVVVVELTCPLDMTLKRSSRNMLGLLHNPMESLLDIHRLAQSLYPNPTNGKSGSSKDLKIKDAASLSGSNLKKELLVPVSSITQPNGHTVFSIYQSNMKIFVRGLDACVHDGGVVIYKISLAKEKLWIKRQVRVLTAQKKRDVAVQPRSAPIRYSYIGTVQAPRERLPCDWKYLTEGERFVLQSNILSKIGDTLKDMDTMVDSDTCVAALAALGLVESSPSMFDKISGMCGVSPSCL